MARAIYEGVVKSEARRLTRPTLCQRAGGAKEISRRREPPENAKTHALAPAGAWESARESPLPNASVPLGLGERGGAVPVVVTTG